MEILETSTPILLTDTEVFAHVCPAAPKPKKRIPQSVLTLEFELQEYLKARPRCPPAALPALLTALARFKLSKVERLQLVNLLPKTPVEFYCVVEDCEERFGEEQVSEIINLLNV